MESDESVRFLDQAGGYSQAIPNNVAVDTGPIIVKMTRRFLKAVADGEGNDGRGHQLRMGVLERRTSGPTVVLEDDDEFKSGVLSESQVPFTVGQQNLLHLPGFHESDALIMHGTFDDDFMLAHAVHLPE